MKNRFLGLLLITTMLISGGVFAQNYQNRKKDLTRWDRERIDRDLRPRGDCGNFFTDEQKETIKELRLELSKQIKPLENELAELEARQHTLSTKEKPDMDAIYKNIDKISGVKTEIAKIMAKHNQDVRAMLTEEQLLKYDAMKKRQLEYHQNVNRSNKMNRFDGKRFERS